MKKNYLTNDFDMTYGDIVIGIDEVGYGALAGPVFVAGVKIDKNFKIEGVRDSKKVSEKKRNSLATQIKLNTEYIILKAEIELIDRINVLAATHETMKDIIKFFANSYDEILLDGNKAPSNTNVQLITKGDDQSAAIASASIIAKVARDEYMCELAKEFPEYNWHKNKGYGTKDHMDALKEFGVNIHHRKSYKPIQELEKVLSLQF